MKKDKDYKKVLDSLQKDFGWEDTKDMSYMEKDLVNDVIKVVKKLTIPVVSSSYVVFEDGADEGIEGMIQLSVPFKTIEEAQTYASSWRSRKTYVAKMIK